MHALTLSPVGVEALDDPATDPQLVVRMLHDIARCNRWLGGSHAMRYALARIIRASDRGGSLTLFDIGTGAGDLPLDAVRWAARRGVTLVPLGLERIPAAARMAQQSGLSVMLGCASALPLRAQSVDIVLISQVAHHLDAASAARLFADASRVARRGVIVADLHRGRLSSAAFGAAAVLMRLHRLTIRDGVTSLRRGYTPDELRALCEEGGVRNASVRDLIFARLVAWWETNSSRDRA